MFELVQAPPPYCKDCKCPHELIKWTADREVYRCNGCWSYGGPLWRLVVVDPPLATSGGQAIENLTPGADTETEIATEITGGQAIENPARSGGNGSDPDPLAMEEIGVFLKTKKLHSTVGDTRTNIGQNQQKSKPKKSTRRAKSRRPTENKGRRSRKITINTLEDYL